MGDMNTLFNLYANGSGTATTSDQNQWQYVASGLSGTPGVLTGSAGSYSVIFTDLGNGAGVEELSATPTHNPGDVNGDKTVDINDLTIVLTDYGRPGGLEPGRLDRRWSG